MHMCRGGLFRIWTKIIFDQTYTRQTRKKRENINSNGLLIRICKREIIVPQNTVTFRVRRVFKSSQIYPDSIIFFFFVLLEYFLLFN